MCCALLNFGPGDVKIDVRAEAFVLTRLIPHTDTPAIIYPLLYIKYINLNFDISNINIEYECLQVQLTSTCKVGPSNNNNKVYAREHIV